MTWDTFFQTILPLLLIVAVSALVGRWVRRTWALGITLFRPYAGRDPWPIGVQEDDDFKFDWSRGPSRDAASADAPDARDGGGGSADAAEARIVELYTRPYPRERPNPLDSHRAPG